MSARLPQVGEAWTYHGDSAVTATVLLVSDEWVGYVERQKGVLGALRLLDTERFLDAFDPPAEPWPDLPPVRWGVQYRSDGRAAMADGAYGEADARRHVALDPAKRRLIRWVPEAVEP